MTRGRRKLVCWLSAAGLLVAAAIGPPLVNADRFASGIRAGLESGLGRHVTVGSVRMHLLPTPGFTVTNVVIGEDPAWGLEPAAYVTSLEARPKIRSLWTGRLEFAALHLEEPSINLVRTMAGGALRWNFESMLPRAYSGSLPDVTIDEGRVNFRFGPVKSMFYFTGATASVHPPSAAGEGWSVQFAGEPARTDRPAHGFGQLAGSVRWRAAGTLELDLRLEKSAIVEMATLVYGRDAGVHGLCSARLRASGRPEDLKITGRVQIEDIHRWDMMPPHGGGWVLAIAGSADLREEVVDIRAVPAGPAPAFALRFRAADLLGDPRWGMVANLRGLPVAPLLETARHMGVPVPQAVEATGTMDGAIGYSRTGGFAGRMGISDATVGVSSGPPVAFDRAVLVFDGPRVRLLPTAARSGNDEVRIEGAYFWNTRLLDVVFRTEGMPVNSPGSRAVLGMVPVLRDAESGLWRGTLRIQWLPEGMAAWTGQVGLEDVRLPQPGLAEPLRVESAFLRLNGSRVTVDSMHALAGGVELFGEYRYDPRFLRPHRFRISVPELSASDLEELLLPTLRRSGGFLARTLGIGSRATPGWLKARHAEGALHIGSLDMGGVAVEHVRTRVLWDGEAVELQGISGELLGGALHGAAFVDLKGAAPAYRLEYRLSGAEWKNGAVSTEGTLQTRGTGLDALRNLVAEGSFEGRSLALDSGTAVDGIKGTFRGTWRGDAPALSFADLEASVGDARFAGKGATGESGELAVELTDGSTDLRFSGTLAQLKVDRVSREH